jgi:ABC-type lipoprotein export system ATPase subunit
MTDAELESYRRGKVGFVFQFLNLIPELTAEENIHLPLELAKRLTKEKKDYISNLLDLVGLSDRKNHRPDELSGGEQQRIGVAAALANDPDIILCDEPTGELDSASKQVVMELLRKVMDAYPNKTMLIVTHDAELKSIADRMYYIRDGVISHTFSPAELEEIKNKPTEEDQGTSAVAPKRGKEEALIELRELDHIIKSKIDKIEKDLHPI